MKSSLLMSTQLIALRFVQENIKRANPHKSQLTYGATELFSFLDRLGDISCLMFVIKRTESSVVKLECLTCCVDVYFLRVQPRPFNWQIRPVPTRLYQAVRVPAFERSGIVDKFNHGAFLSRFCDVPRAIRSMKCPANGCPGQWLNLNGPSRWHWHPSGCHMTTHMMSHIRLGVIMFG
jgi:hypothetical protein